MVRARRLLAFLLLALGPGLAMAGGDLSRALALATRGERVSDSVHVSALRLLVDHGLTQGDSHASSWAYLDLWLRAEWEQDELLPARREGFRKQWPRSRYQEHADWLLARWLLDHGRQVEGLALMLELAASSRDSALRQRAEHRLDGLLGNPGLVDGATLLDLDTGSSPAGRRWLVAWRERTRVRRVLGLVAPLSGPDAAVGKALVMGTEAALRQHMNMGRDPWELRLSDCQSDPLLARELLGWALSRNPDAVLLPGDPAYAMAAAGVEQGTLLLVPGYGGPPASSLSPDLLHLDLDPRALGGLMADLVRDSLGLGHVGILAPATRSARRVVEALQENLRTHGEVEVGQLQWYFPGARELDHQVESLHQFGGGFPHAGAWIVLGSEGEGTVLRNALEHVPAGGFVIVDGALLEALDGQVPATLAGRMLGVTAWLPTSWAQSAGLAQAWSLFHQETLLRLGRPPTSAESRAFESVRLLLLAGDLAETQGRGLRGAMDGLPASGLWGPALDLIGQEPAGAWLLGWDGRTFTIQGSRVAAEGTH